MAQLISAHNLAKSFGTQELFRGLSFGIESGDRIGLIGPNGSGKSTLLKILAGLTKADDGRLSWQRGLRIGYLAQTPEFQDGATILSAVSEKIENLHEDWEALARVHELLSKFDLLSEGRNEETPVAELSGGWKKRLALVRELTQGPDLLLLDEPTNHLDIESILWLEELLNSLQIATLTITHDRLFLQKVSNRILELDRRNPNGLLSVNGDYATYLETKEQVLATLDRREQVMKNTLRRETEWLRRGAKARQTKQQGRIQRAEVLKDDVSELSRRTATRTLNLEFQNAERNPKRLIEARKISKSYGDHALFSDLDLFIGPRTRLGLLGQNGCGKSTLIRVLLGSEAPDQGKILRAENLQVNYFEQNRESLDFAKNPIQTLCPMGDHVSYQGKFVHVRGYLDRFLFSPQQAEQPVGRLSGGEQSRLLLAQLMLKEANVLVLDEPTNDLDLATLNVLEECLTEFNGAVILVTHDRYFLDQVSNQIVAFPPTQALASHQGVLQKFASLDQWESWHQEILREGLRKSAAEAKKAGPKEATNSPAPAKKLSFKDQRELDGMEALIQTKEAEFAKLTAELELPSTTKNPENLRQATTAVGRLQSEIERLYQRWSELEVLARPKC